MAATVKMWNGVEMPLFGLGTWMCKKEEGERSVRTALDAGYRLIDTAEAYENEQDIGNVLKEYLDAGKIKREDVFVTTKFLDIGKFGRETVLPALEASLRRLNLDYVDLYLTHHPWTLNLENNKLIVPQSAADRDITDNWKGMEDVYKKGLTKSIGVSNYSVEQVDRIIDTCEIKPHNIQVEMHAYFPQFELQREMEKRGLTITAFAPIGSPGRLAFSHPIITSDWPIVPSQLEEPVVLDIAKAHSKTAAQVLLRRLVQRNVSAIPKSTSPKRIVENLQIFDFELTKDEMHKLDNLKTRKRLFECKWARGHPEYTYEADIGTDD